MPQFLKKHKIPVAIILPIAWLGTSTILIFSFVFISLFSSPTKITNKHSLFSSKPLTTSTMISGTGTGDPRSAKIDSVFDKFNCPLHGLGETFVREADKNDIPYWIVAAIAFQESSCGKNIPKKNGVFSYNAWGWGVYGDKVSMFDDWHDGISTVSKYLSENFFSNGVTDPCEIMKTYTPPSNGSWCEGIEYFRDTIDEYTSPINSDL